VQFRHALSRTLTAQILYGTAALAWGGASAAAAENVRTDVMLLLAVAALATTIIAFQHTMLGRHQAISESLTRAVVNRPHDRDHEVTGPFATVSGLRERRGQSASR